MSFCRWSTNDFQCDLYCYESYDGRFMAHVAAGRTHWKVELPRKESIYFKSGRLNKSALRRDTKRFCDVLKMLDNDDNFENVPIGLAYDGQTFSDDTVEEFKETLELLKAVGYRFPDFEIE